MPVLCDYKDCTGCGACYASCAHKAIDLNVDKYGFLHPFIKKEKCINCHLCEKKCPILHSQVLNLPIKTYAAYNRDSSERFRSSSGGIATLVSRSFILNGGIVYGCSFISPMSFKHVRCSKIEDLDILCGSKYVQSDLRDIFLSIKNDLKNKLKVLFIGTPCQVAAIKSLCPNRENLSTLDIVCHGIGNTDYLKNTLSPEIINIPKKNICFRKSTTYRFSIYSKDCRVIYDRTLDNDEYMKAFFNGLIFRLSCFHCRFARRERISDVTCGDFWGLKSNKLREKGISLVLLNTEKGKEIFNAIKDSIEFEERSLSEALEGNQQLNHPFPFSKRIKFFRYLYPLIGFYQSLWCVLPAKMFYMKLKYLISNK